MDTELVLGPDQAMQVDRNASAWMRLQGKSLGDESGTENAELWNRMGHEYREAERHRLLFESYLARAQVTGFAIARAVAGTRPGPAEASGSGTRREDDDEEEGEEEEEESGDEVPRKRRRVAEDDE